MHQHRLNSSFRSFVMDGPDLATLHSLTGLISYTRPPADTFRHSQVFGPSQKPISAVPYHETIILHTTQSLFCHGWIFFVLFFLFSSDHQQAPWVVLSAFQLSDVLAPSNELGNVFFSCF